MVGGTVYLRNAWTHHPSETKDVNPGDHITHIRNSSEHILSEVILGNVVMMMMMMMIIIIIINTFINVPA
jgi:hypothetical protein